MNTTPAHLSTASRRLRPLQSAVIALRLTGFDRQTVADQAQRRAGLMTLVAELAALWPQDARVVLESPDGAAIVALDDPVPALDAAQRVVAARQDIAVGLHHGPVAAQAGHGAVRVSGDGVETAAVVASFSGRHPVLASRAFRLALVAAAPRRAEALRPAGEFVDDKLRPHELYAFDPDAARARQRRRLLLGGAGIAAILAAGVLVRAVRQRRAAQRRPAVINLDIKPGGEVWVDGELKGTAPPLSRLWIPPGAHVIEVRNPRFRPLRLEVQLQPGEELEVRHNFVANAPPRQRSLLDRLKFW